MSEKDKEGDLKLETTEKKDKWRKRKKCRDREKYVEKETENNSDAEKESKPIIFVHVIDYLIVLLP